MLVIFGLAYLISPVDIIPDLLLPWFGWIDDGFVIGTIVYLIRYGKLPNFFFKKNPDLNRNSFQERPGSASTENTGQTENNKTDNNRTSRAGSNRTTQDKSRTNFKDSSSKIKKTPFEVLGISPRASRKEIQTAYKDAIKKYHPDKLSHLGEEFSNLANEKFLEVQEAYDTLMNM
jgi:hypothetical protein